MSMAFTSICCIPNESWPQRQRGIKQCAFHFSNGVKVGSNPTRGMAVWIYTLFVLSRVDRGVLMCRFPIRGVVSDVSSIFPLVSLGGMRLSPLGTSAPNDRWWRMWNSQWNDWQGKPKFPETTCSIATLSITNSTWLDLGSNPSLRGGKLASKPPELRYGLSVVSK
jgi:hypothetical protein